MLSGTSSDSNTTPPPNDCPKINFKVNLYGNGHAAEKIAAELKDWL